MAVPGLNPFHLEAVTELIAALLSSCVCHLLIAISQNVLPTSCNSLEGIHGNPNKKEN